MASPRQKEHAKSLISAFKTRLRKENLDARVKGDTGKYEAINVVAPSYDKPFTEAQKQTILKIAHGSGFTGVRGSTLDPTGTADPHQIKLYYDTKPVAPDKILTAAARVKLPKVKRGELRHVIVTDKRDGKKHKVLTSVLPGTGFPVIYESPSNLHRKGQKLGMLLVHDKIVRGEVHATKEHFIEAYRSLKKLEHSQGLPPEEQSRYYEATMAEIKPSKKETTAMSSISTLVASAGMRVPVPEKPKSPSIDMLIAATAKKTVAKAGVKKKPVKAAPATKSLSGLQIKLDALAKRYPGVTFEVQRLKTKQNQIKVSGLGKMVQKDLFELFKKIPNTNHIPNRMAAGTAYFTLFGKKELTASDETVEAADKKPRPYYVMVEKSAKNNRWSVQFGDYDPKVVREEIADQKRQGKDAGEKYEYKMLKVANARQKTVDEAVKALTASEAPGKSLGSVASLIAALPVSNLSRGNLGKDNGKKTRPIRTEVRMFDSSARTT